MRAVFHARNALCKFVWSDTLCRNSRITKTVKPFPLKIFYFWFQYCGDNIILLFSLELHVIATFLHIAQLSKELQILYWLDIQESNYANALNIGFELKVGHFIETALRT